MLREKILELVREGTLKRNDIIESLKSEFSVKDIWKEISTMIKEKILLPNYGELFIIEENVRELSEMKKKGNVSKGTGKGKNVALRRNTSEKKIKESKKEAEIVNKKKNKKKIDWNAIFGKKKLKKKKDSSTKKHQKINKDVRKKGGRKKLTLKEWVKNIRRSK